MEGFRRTNIESIFILGTLALVFVIGMTSPAFATTTTFSDFSDTTGLTLSGNAVGNINNGDDLDPVLRLVPDTTLQSGSVFSSVTVNTSDFSTKFQFRITNPGGVSDGTEIGADGFVFVIQPISDDLGGLGGGMGYEGIPTSVGIEFDTFQNTPDPNSNHVGILTNGSVDTILDDNSVPIDIRFDDADDGILQTAWIDYDGTTLRVFIAQADEDEPDKPDDPVLVLSPIDIPAILGGTSAPVDDAFVGFTAGTGGGTGNYDIVNWTYSDSFIPTTGDGFYGSDRDGFIFLFDPSGPTITDINLYGATTGSTEIECTSDGVDCFSYSTSEEKSRTIERFDPSFPALLGEPVTTDHGPYNALEYVGSTLYGIYPSRGFEPQSVLDTLNPLTGGFDEIGPTGISSPMTGLAFDTVNEIMYAVSSGSSSRSDCEGRRRPADRA